MVRRIIVSDDANYDYSKHADGIRESLLVVDRDIVKSPADAEAQVAKATGQQPADYTCAVVDKSGSVVLMTKADPAIDTHPAGDLVLAPDGIAVGNVFDFKAKTFTIPAQITPATFDKDGKQVAAITIPEKTIAAGG